MVECLPLQVAADIKLRLAGPVGRDVIRSRLHQHHQHIEREEAAEAVHRAVGDEMIDGVLLEQRDHYVHHAPERAEKHHRKQQPAIARQIARELRNSEQAKMRLLLHVSASSPMAICMS